MRNTTSVRTTIAMLTSVFVLSACNGGSSPDQPAISESTGGSATVGVPGIGSAIPSTETPVTESPTTQNPTDENPITETPPNASQTPAPELTESNSGTDISVQPNRAPSISGSPAISVEVDSNYSFIPTAIDLDGDTLTFSVENLPTWAVFDNTTGSLNGTPDYTQFGTHQNIVISVEDQLEQTQLAAFSINVTMDEVELALISGDASVVRMSSQIEDALLDEITAATNLHSADIAQIYNLNTDGTAKSDGSSLTAIDWNPTHDAAILSAEFGENANLMLTNAVSVDTHDVAVRPLAVIGKSNARYIVMGGNPMRNYRRNSTSLNEQMHQYLENSLSWLIDRDDLKNAPSSIVIAQLEQSYYFPDELAVREWLDERYPTQFTYNDQNACDADALANCLSKSTDLLILSNNLDTGDAEKESIIINAVTTAMQQGVPVLYMHVDGGSNSLSDALLPIFEVQHAADNYWNRLSLSHYDTSVYLGNLTPEIASVQTMVSNFRQSDFAVDWSTCDPDNPENCRNNTSLYTQFLDGASAARSLLRARDKNKSNVFASQTKYRFTKLLALLGDHYRTGVSFPMDRTNTPSTEFFRAYYADHATYQYRHTLGMWSDLGNYSRSDFSHITPTNRTVNHISKRHFKSTGAYAIPGQVVTVTRNDNSDVVVKVRVGTLRDGSTRIFANDGYKRPRLLQNQSMSIEHGETIEFISSKGGPLQLEYDTNDLPVEIVFENIGEHAYWSNDADDASFAAKLAANEFDWAELAAPSFEVHSKLDKMIDSMNDPMFGPSGGTPKELSDATMRYVHNFPHVLAGFKGTGVDVVDEIHQFAADNSLDIANLDLIKHMNADQASCGYGCSGNPYDAYWSFSPIGHGDIHELGHGLERDRFRFQGWQGHSTTNPYSYYTKSQYFKDSGEDPNCQSLPFQENFEVLQASLAAADPTAYMKTNLWTDPNWNTSVAMTIQMMMAAQDNGALTDGWHLLARMHIIEREYQKAIRNDTEWAAKRVGLGMDMYDRTSAKEMNKEDWLLIVISHATGFDMRAYFDVWGHVYTAPAAAQVAAMALPSMPINYYVSSAKGYCKGEGFDGSKLPIDGIATWPTTP